ncbi:uncharacterized protein LOC141598737 isoform X2 [Silene latifolia]|uniref:uncharacterized protein LOC141598737 isoform X2 n=1 Tax=Silene latifolia TaxID=37657 RepID=UPI003D78132D
MFGLVNSFWCSLWSYILHVFSLFSRFSVEKVENWTENDDHGIKSEEKVEEIKGFDDQIEEKEMESVVNANANTSKYQFFSGNSVCAFVEEPVQTTMNFTVHEMFVFSNDGFNPKQELVQKVDSFFDDEIQGVSVDLDVNLEPPLVKNRVSDVLSRDDEVVKCGESENLGFEPSCDDHVLVHNDCVDGLSREDEVVECGESENLGFDDQILGHNECDDQFSRKDEVVECGESENLGFDDQILGHNECDDQFSREDEVVEHKIVESPVVCDLNFDEKDGSSVSQDELSEKEEGISLDEIIDRVEVSDHVHSSNANSDDFWSAIYEHDCVFGNHDEIMVDSEEYPLKSLDDSSIDRNSSSLDDVSVESEHDQEVDSSFIELDPHTVDEFSDSDESDGECSTLDEMRRVDSSESCDEGEVQVENDVLLEQKELIRQMKREMRQLKVSGLPTILEESESPRVEDDLRPLRIDERIRHKDRMDEIQIFYKRYLDKMRKLDISSQQTMYAIGLLQLKSQDQLDMNKKVSVPVMKSVLAQNFWSNKQRKHEADHVKKLIRDLKRELELVYVGQICNSWEILKWQYRKVEELQTHDPDGFRQYNQVAGEFQKFQVLLQRFTEDEPFHHGPRVQHYLKSRYAVSNLLQVPLIKDDSKNELRGDREGAISISMLKEVIMSSMRSFWDFIRTDKDEVHAITLMGIHGVHVDLQDPSDTDLLTETRSSLHKKEKRLKDLVRSGNCIVRKFQKHQESRLSPEMFLAQVELRLVSRVLNMSTLSTEQLLWCHKKMNKTNIIGRKVYIESSFLLFPF